MPVTAPPIKVEAVRSHGAQVILQGKSFAEAFAAAKQLEEKEGSIFVSPYDDEHIVAGQGTVGMEMLSSANGKPLDIIGWVITTPPRGGYNNPPWGLL